MTNSDLLRKLCKADPRWTIQNHADNNHFGITMNEELFLGVRPDGSLDGDGYWSLLMEQIARLAELDAHCVASESLSELEHQEYEVLNDRLRLAGMYQASPRYILETQIAWSECRKQEVG